MTYGFVVIQLPVLPIRSANMLVKIKHFSHNLYIIHKKSFSGLEFGQNFVFPMMIGLQMSHW